MKRDIKVKRIFEVNLVVFINIIINLSILGCDCCCRKKGFSHDVSTHDSLICKLPTISGKKINKLKKEVVKCNSDGSFSDKKNNKKIPNKKDVYNFLDMNICENAN